MADGREAEGRLDARDVQVATERDLQAAAEARPLNGGDGRDRNRLDRRQRNVPTPEPIGAEPFAGERRAVDSGAERAPASADEDCARSLV